ncbi:CMGC/CDK protein kinase [Lyophyllum atratum]|nr:CMGC/CDK protein kinase [Lyophyllum atratum]
MSLIQPVEIDNDYEVIEEGPASKIARTWAAIGSKEPQWVIVKSATVVRKFSKEPHDILKELRILSTLSHPNIINVLNHVEDTQWCILHLWMPYIPLSLPDLLASPRFSPHYTPPSSDDDEEAKSLRRRVFTSLTQSIMYQTLLALAYLHDDTNRIAHRDIKPHNLHLATDGCVKLIDFGIAYKDAEDAEAKQNDMWPEHRPKLYFEVSTGPYRAPELLFGTRDYDAAAIDLWSLGATFAEFFTPLRLYSEEDEEEDEYGGVHHVGDESRPLAPFIVPENVPPGAPGTWGRDMLFNGTRGELGLAWSIFKIRGTPTPENWPAFESLPDAHGVQFTVVPHVPLAPLLVNLPPEEEGGAEAGGNEVGDGVQVHFPERDMVPSALDLVSRLLVYPSENRLKASRALEHPWFGDGVLMPEGYSVPPGEMPGKGFVRDVEGKTLGEWVQLMLDPAGEY